MRSLLDADVFSPCPAATPGVQVLTGDFNGDGRTDIALTGVAGWASIPVALSNGDGTFQVVNRLDPYGLPEADSLLLGWSLLKCGPG